MSSFETAQGHAFTSAKSITLRQSGKSSDDLARCLTDTKNKQRMTAIAVCKMSFKKLTVSTFSQKPEAKVVGRSL